MINIYYAILLLFTFFHSSILMKDGPTTANEDKASADVHILPDNSSSIGFEDKQPKFRLPDHLKVTHYFIQIHPIYDNDTQFEGKVVINLDVKKRTSSIVLNSLDLEIFNYSLKVKNDKRTDRPVKILDHRYYPETSMSYFDLGDSLLPGSSVELTVQYFGKLLFNSFGLNAITYQDKDGHNRRIISTYFQPIGARNVFPCMDEPSLKAKFKLRIAKLNETDNVLSNMDVNNTLLSEDGTYTWVEFNETPPMSTYLVAFSLGNFTTLSNLKKTKVWSIESSVPSTFYASNLAPKSVNWFNKYFSTPFPLPKLDILIFPSYAVPGMENFGLITAEESSVLTNGKLLRKEWVSTVVAHEIAHQWIGNLATPQWWGEFWLSEGFATYFAARCLEELESGHGAINNMLFEIQRLQPQDTEERSASLFVPEPYPLQKPPKDTISYFKGAAMFRMVNSIVGENHFRDGFKKFFNRFKYQSFSTKEIFDTIAESIPFDARLGLPASLGDIVNSWAALESFPLVTVKRKENGNLVVTQEKIFGTPGSTEEWWIPLSYASSRRPNFADTSPRAWLQPNQTLVDINDVDHNDTWIVFNIQNTVYARINYDNALWKSISKQLLENHHSVHVLNRAKLIDDAFYLFMEGDIGTSPAMEILLYLPKEEEYPPLKNAFDALSSIEVYFKRNSSYDMFKQFVSSILSSNMALMRRPNSTASHESLKSYYLLLSWTCKIKMVSCQQIADGYFQKWKKSNDLSVYPEFGFEDYMCFSIFSGTDQDWNVVFERVMDVEEPESMLSLIKVLACTNNGHLIQKYLESTLNSSINYTPKHLQDVFNTLTASSLWSNATWQFINDNWNNLTKLYGSPPLPFVILHEDLYQLKRTIKQHIAVQFGLDDERVEAYVSSNRKYAEKSQRVIDGVTKWLVTHSGNNFTSLGSLYL